MIWCRSYFIFVGLDMHLPQHCFLKGHLSASNCLVYLSNISSSIIQAWYICQSSQCLGGCSRSMVSSSQHILQTLHTSLMPASDTGKMLTQYRQWSVNVWVWAWAVDFALSLANFDSIACWSNYCRFKQRSPIRQCCSLPLSVSKVFPQGMYLIYNV